MNQRFMDRTGRAMLSKLNNIVKSNHSEQWRSKNGLADSIDEINMTIEIALGFIDPFFGSCIRCDKLDNSVIQALVNGSII